MKNVTKRFWELVDSETVRLFVWPYYLSLLAYGVWATTHRWPSNVIEPVIGPQIYHFWAIMHIPGTLFVLIGLILRHGGKPLSEMGPVLLFNDYIGLHMQRGGHICMAIILGVFEYSMIWGYLHGISNQTYVIFLVSPYVLGCVFLAIQVHRKIAQGEALHKKIKGGHAR